MKKTFAEKFIGLISAMLPALITLVTVSAMIAGLKTDGKYLRRDIDNLTIAVDSLEESLIRNHSLSDDFLRKLDRILEKD